MKKSKIILSSIFILLSVFFLVAGLIQRNKCIYSYNTADIHAGEYEKKIVEGINLTPGIYRIDIEYNCQTHNSDMYIAFLTPRVRKANKNVLKSTGGNLYLNKKTESQEFYLYRKTSDLYLELNAYYDDFSIESIRIINTGKHWFCISFLIMCVYLVLMYLLYLCEKINNGKISEKEIIRLISFAGIWIISSLPILCENTILTADGPYHMERVEGVANALRSGLIPVRLEPTWLQSYGYGNGLFYCDLFLVFPALLRLIGFSVTSSYNAYLLAVNALIIFASGYVFRGLVRNENIALITTAMYSLSEIKYYQFINKGTLGEGTALIFLPVVLLGLYKILYVENNSNCPKETIDAKEKCSKKIESGWICLAIGYSGLICSHILSTEITLFVTCLIVIFNIRKIFKKNVILDILKAIGTTILLTCWFTVPFIESYLFEDVNIKHSFARTIQGEGLTFSQLFINFFGRYAEGKTKGIYALESVGLGIPLMIGIIVFTGLIISAIIKKNGLDDKLKFSIGVCISAIILIVFSLRVFPWDLIQQKNDWLAPFISSIQFPRRFLEWGTLLCVVVLGVSLEQLFKNKKKIHYYSLMILTVVGIVFSFVSRLDYDVATRLKYPLGNFEGIRIDYVAGGEYVLYGTDLSKLEYNKIEASDDIYISDYTSGNLSGVLFVKNNGLKEGYVEFPLLNYRHYLAKDNNGNVIQIVNGNNNVVRTIIPSGFSGQILVRYKPPVYWHIVELISIISVAAFMVYIIICYRKYKDCLCSSNNNQEV